MVESHVAIKSDRLVSYLLEGRSLHPHRPLPRIGERKLVYAYDVSGGEVLFDASTNPTGPTEPYLPKWVVPGVQSQILTTWVVD